VSASIRFFRFSRVVAAAAVVGWLCCAGPARAGDGGEDAANLQQILDGICPLVGMTPTTCPKLPTGAQMALEISGLINSQIDDVKNAYFVPFGSSNPCGNFVIATQIPCTEVAINAVNAPVKSPPEGPLAISYLTPLAFKPVTGAICTGKISGTTLNVSSCASGKLQVQDVISGTGISQPAYIVDIGTCASPPGSCTLNAAQTVTVPETITAQRAVVTQYGDPAAKRFLYAALIEGSDGQPQLLDVVLDDTLSTKKQFSKGPVVAFSLPLVVLKGGIEYPVAATLQLTATCNGAADCLAGTVTGTFPTFPGVAKKSYSAAALGLTFSSSFDASPNSATPHRKYELQIPIIATPDTDPAYFAQTPMTTQQCPKVNGPPPPLYFANALSGYCNAFATPGVLGFLTPVLGAGASIGIAPYAAPQCTSATCPTDGSTATPFFGFCASFPAGPTFLPGVATFLQIATTGMTSASTPLATQNLQCPALN
jgi:hypothetical protein